MAFLAALDPREVLTVVIGVLAIVLFGLASGLLVARGWRDLLRRYRSRHLAEDEAAILAFTRTGNVRLLDAVTRTSALRNRIAKLGAASTGEERTKLMLAYTTLGFTAIDFRRLRGRRHQRVARALLRCRDLMVPIPNDGWRLLVHHRRPIFRWAAMEYLVAAKGQASLPWFMAFYVDPRNREPGVNLHLLACIARDDARILKFLLERTDDPELIRLVLSTLAHYPDPSAVDTILAAVRSDADEEALIAAVRAVAAGPCEAAFRFLERMRTHEHWVVRLYAARGFGAYFDVNALDHLVDLARDPLFEVRRAAVTSMFALRPLSMRSLVEIIDETSHPAAPIVRDLEEMQTKLGGASL